MTPSESDNEPTLPGVELKGGAAALRPYLGQVVAIVDGEVRAFGKTWAECLQAVRQAQLVDPELLFVPNGALVG